MIESRRSDDKNYTKGYVSFIGAMRQEIWGVVLEKIDIQKFITYKVRENFTQFAHQRGYLNFALRMWSGWCNSCSIMRR